MTRVQTNWCFGNRNRIPNFQLWIRLNRNRIPNFQIWIRLNRNRIPNFENRIRLNRNRIQNFWIWIRLNRNRILTEYSAEFYKFFNHDFQHIFRIFTVCRLRNKQKDFLLSRETPYTTRKYKYKYSLSNIDYLAKLLAENCIFVWTL